MNIQAKKMIYIALHPEFLMIIKNNHVSSDEVNEIIRIMELIHNYDLFFKNNMKLPYTDYEMFVELCTISDKRFLKFINADLINYIKGLGFFCEDIITFIRYLKQYFDYQKYGDLIYVHMSSSLWYNYFWESKKPDDIILNNLIVDYSTIIDDIISIDKSMGDRGTFIDFFKLFFTYLYMNNDKYDTDLLLQGFNMMKENHYLEHMSLNGAFNNSLENINKIRMFYIKEIIDNLNNNKNK